MYKVVALVILLGGVAHANSKASITFEGWTSKASLDDKAIVRIVKTTKSKALACYKKALKNNQILSGSAKVTFTIGVDGKVTTATMADDLGASLGTCVAAAFAKLKFPKPKDGAAADVSYLLSFDPGVQGGAFASLTGTGDISSGFDDTDIYGGLLGSSAGSGSGVGGGGIGIGTIGTGTYGKIGHGSGTGSGYGVGSGRGGMRGRGAPVPTVGIGQPGATGDLDKAIIRRYIKRNIQKIQYCYEKQLITKPRLQGTVTIEFTIAVDGKVTSSKAASGIDTDVDTCVAAVIKAIEFPKPKSGVVNVKYPFTFRPADTTPPQTKSAPPAKTTTTDLPN